MFRRRVPYKKARRIAAKHPPLPGGTLTAERTLIRGGSEENAGRACMFDSQHTVYVSRAVELLSPNQLAIL